jgi:capsid protein
LGYAAAETERPRWAAPVPVTLDTKQEILSDVLAIRAGLTSRKAVVESNGDNVEDIDRELAADQERARSLGLTLDVDSAKTQLGQTQPAVADPTNTTEVQNP